MKETRTDNPAPNQLSEELSNDSFEEQLLAARIEIDSSEAQDFIAIDEAQDFIAIDEEQESIPIDGEQESIAIDEEQESIPIDGEQESIPIDGEQESIPIDEAQESIPIDGEQESIPIEQQATREEKTISEPLEEDKDWFTLAQKQSQQNQELMETIGGLDQQLEASQKLVARLEREYALLQKSEQEKAERILQLERQERELKARLTRQQRHALQFKAALDRCLEVPGYISQGEDTGKIEPVSPPNITISSKSPIPKIQPIKPWSSQLDQLTNPSTEDFQETSCASSKQPPEKNSEPCEPEIELEQPVTNTNAWEKTKFLEEMLLEVNNSKSLENTSSPANWPSPTINGLGTGKKRKSRAEIDLPAFAPPKTSN